jgi:hypothetical protein
MSAPIEKPALGKEVAAAPDLPKAPREWVCVLFVKDALALPIGTPVLVVDDRRIVETRTTRKPSDRGGQPVVDLEAFDHPYAMHLVYVLGRFRAEVRRG